MSFTTSREYPRSILRPLRLKDVTTLSRSKAITTKQRPQSTSSVWKATWHVFSGTGNRHLADHWPPTNFDHDPSEIPDDNSYDILYDSKTANAHSDTYNMFEVTHESENSVPEPVPIPYLVAKRYIPRDQGRNKVGEGITLLMLTGMGVPKEMFEPLIDRLIPQLIRGGIKIEEIWTIDMPLSGESAVLNPVGYFYGNEKDIARDILLFVTAFLPVVASQSLPVELIPRRPKPNDKNITRKNLHVVAHSLGAQAAMLVAAHAPNIFSSLSLIDPAMVPSGKISNMFTKLPKDVFCFNIGEHYENSDQLASALRSNKRTQRWDAQAIETFVAMATEPDASGGIRLIARPRLEWALYYDKETPTQCFDRLKDITAPFHAIMPTRPFAVPRKQFEMDVSHLEQEARIVWIENATHQLPYERLDECAEAVFLWLRDIHKAGEAQARL